MTRLVEGGYAVILAIDQGTTGTMCVIYNSKGQAEAKSYVEIQQHYPEPGWVEHDAEEIWDSVVSAIGRLPRSLLDGVKAIGITNQRETTVVWDKSTGKPIHKAIVWQCRRTAGMCEKMSQFAPVVKSKTGLPIDAYFSGTKIKWLLDNNRGHDVNKLLFGTIDSWLIWKLTGGKTHATDYTNASRTIIFNIHTKTWDKELCDIFGIPMSILPRVQNSIDDYGVADIPGTNVSLPIYGVAGDQQAAMFGQCCFSEGQMKNTYGTGCFALMNTGDKKVISNDLVTTLAVSGNGSPCYALEGSIFIGGAAVQWLRDELGFIKHASETDKIASSISDSGGVYLVPAFVGLGAPYWDSDARGVLCGLTRGSGRSQIVRAALESICYQTADVIKAMENESGIVVSSLAVDGGAVENDFLMQFQSDILDKRVLRPAVIESTSLGAAYLAGLKAGVWQNTKGLESHKAIQTTFSPLMDESVRGELLRGWMAAVSKSRLV